MILVGIMHHGDRLFGGLSFDGVAAVDPQVALTHIRHHELRHQSSFPSDVGVTGLAQLSQSR